jgi:hypothetical protein
MSCNLCTTTKATEKQELKVYNDQPPQPNACTFAVSCIDQIPGKPRGVCNVKKKQERIEFTAQLQLYKCSLRRRIKRYLDRVMLLLYNVYLDVYNRNEYTYKNIDFTTFMFVILEAFGDISRHHAE